MAPPARRVAPSMRAAREPLHVVTLIDLVAEAGGAETLAVELLDRLDPARFARTLVLYRHLPESSPLHAGQERLLRRLSARGGRIVRLDGRSRRDLASWRPFLALLRSGDVDILHTHKFGPNFWGSVASRLARGPVFIAHEHTWSFEGRPLRKLVDRFLIATRCAAFLVVSERDRRRMIEVEHIPAGCIRLLANGIPAPVPDPAADVRALFGIPAGAPLIGSVGVFRAQKDLGTLLEAHALVRRRRPDARLVLVGDGPERARLEAHREQLGLSEHVVLTGLRSDAPSLAAGFDVAVNSSRFEGAALAILEGAGARGWRSWSVGRSASRSSPPRWAARPSCWTAGAPGPWCRPATRRRSRPGSRACWPTASAPRRSVRAPASASASTTTSTARSGGSRRSTWSS